MSLSDVGIINLPYPNATEGKPLLQFKRRIRMKRRNNIYNGEFIQVLVHLSFLCLGRMSDECSRFYSCALKQLDRKRKLLTLVVE